MKHIIRNIKNATSVCKKIKHLALVLITGSALNASAQGGAFTLTDTCHKFPSVSLDAPIEGVIYLVNHLNNNPHTILNFGCGNQYYNSEACQPNSKPWHLGGDVIAPPITPTTGFVPFVDNSQLDIGTCNEFPFVLKANNNRCVFVTPQGNIGIGSDNDAPTAPLDISSTATNAIATHFKIYGDAGGSVEATNNMNLYQNGEFVVSQGNISSSSRVFATHSTGFDIYNGIDFHVLNTANNDYVFKVESGTGKTIIGEKTQTSGAHSNAWLTVNGKAVCREMIVTLNNWADYVFANNYKLQSLESLDNYIKQHGHLPNVPTAKDIEANGADLGELSRIQMEKIEELTLYVIELKKEVEALKKQVKDK
ncbi:MAG: hypothetical protein KF900_00180 [Bacteroidetes bacterium]|nr:hypothetical protein [Bacteroidota bacterium]